MYEFKSLTNKQLSEMVYKSLIAVNSLTKSMSSNDRQYLIKRHEDLTSEVLRRGGLLKVDRELSALQLQNILKLIIL